MGKGRAGKNMDKKRILVVEGDPRVASDLKIKLERLGYEVPLLASTAEQAVEAARVLGPDLVLLDSGLPGEGGGAAAAEAVRATGVPVVCLVAEGAADVLQRARTADPFGYLTKPLSDRELEAVVALARYRDVVQDRVRHLARLAGALTALCEPVFVLDTRGRLRYCNPAAARWLAWRPGPQAPRPWLEAIPLYDESGDQEGLREAFQRVVSRGETVRGEARLNPPVAYALCPLREDGREVVGVVLWLRDISERLEAERRREALVEQLRLANKALESFVYTVSHDLKTPLAALGGHADLLEKDLAKGDGQAAARDLRELRGAAARMEGLVNGLLRLSRAGRVLGEERETDLEVLVQEVLAERHSLIDGARALVEVADRWPRVRVDPLRLKEALGCLVDNALKYRRPEVQAHVTIGWREGGDGLRLFVRDNGRGIPLADQDRIFGLFERGGREDQDGSGVGLALARRIAEAHGGRLTVESVPGVGSTFWFTLPRERRVD